MAKTSEANAPIAPVSYDRSIPREIEWKDDRSHKPEAMTRFGGHGSGEKRRSSTG